MSNRLTATGDQKHENRLTGDESAQVLMLTMQMQTLALAVEDLRLRMVEIEHHLDLQPEAKTRRADRRKLERIW